MPPFGWTHGQLRENNILKKDAMKDNIIVAEVLVLTGLLDFMDGFKAIPEICEKDINN